MDNTDAEHDPIREEALDWLLRITEAPQDPSLRSALSAWRAQSHAHDRAFLSVARMWRVSGGLPREAVDVSARPLPRRTRTARNDGARPSGWTRRRTAAGALAAGIAAVLLLTLAPALQHRLAADHATGVGERRTVRLADGSALHLDADSAVAVDFRQSERAVTLLSGRAFFDVARAADRPFTVTADGLVVTVRGTGFAVSAGRDAISVAVAEGKVEAAPKAGDAQHVSLRPGDRLTLSRATGAVALTKVPPADVAAWRDGQLVVDGLTLREVAEQIGRYHRGLILIPDGGLAARRITGVFNLDNPVAALKAAARTQSAEVTELTPYLLLVAPR
jgi:transmembrane sensor